MSTQPQHPQHCLSHRKINTNVQKKTDVGTKPIEFVYFNTPWDPPRVNWECFIDYDAMNFPVKGSKEDIEIRPTMKLFRCCCSCSFCESAREYEMLQRVDYRMIYDSRKTDVWEAQVEILRSTRFWYFNPPPQKQSGSQPSSKIVLPLTISTSGSVKMVPRLVNLPHPPQTLDDHEPIQPFKTNSEKIFEFQDSTAPISTPRIRLETILEENPMLFEQPHVHLPLTHDEIVQIIPAESSTQPLSSQQTDQRIVVEDVDNVEPTTTPVKRIRKQPTINKKTPPDDTAPKKKTKK